MKKLLKKSKEKEFECIETRNENNEINREELVKESDRGNTNKERKKYFKKVTNDEVQFWFISFWK